MEKQNIKLFTNKIFCSDALLFLKTLPDNSINCCISSPPYWALRDYGTAKWEGGDVNCDHKPPDDAGQSQKQTEGQRQHPGRFIGEFCYKCGARRIDLQLGLEKTFEEYLDKLLAIYDEVFRVLRKDGTCFVNLGDSYSGSGGEHKPWHKSDTGFQHNAGFSKECLESEFVKPTCNLPAKCLCMIPERFAIGMIERGWILRNKIIWHKCNPMPSSASDRFTIDFEPVFFFVKNKQYFFEPQYEEYTESSTGRYALASQRNMETFSQTKDFAGGGGLANENLPHIYKAGQGTVKSRGNGVDHLCVGGNNPLGRNKRCVFNYETKYATIRSDITEEQKQYVLNELAKRNII